MFMFFVFGCTPSIDCDGSENVWDSGQAYNNIGMNFTHESSQDPPDSEAYQLETKQPGSLFNGISLSMSIANLQSDTGRLVIYQQEAQPVVDLVPSFETTSTIAQEVSGLGKVIYDEKIEPESFGGDRFELLHILANQYAPVTYLTFVVSKLSILEVFADVDLSYCDRSSPFLKGETGGNLEITELWDSSSSSSILPPEEPAEEPTEENTGPPSD
ncbi:MAG: hypothetical protein CMK59_03575 [Proteobacteria bacterium]|nr:hypothetical protein [Pseudomonadota bacterium]